MRAREYVERLGIRVDEACRDYAEAKKVLGTESLLKAAEYYAKHRPDSLPKKTVPQAIQELLRDREQDRCSDVYLKALKTALTRFQTDFPGLIVEVRRAQIQDHLRSAYAKLSARSRNNAASYIRTLFSFAKREGYLPRDQETEATELARAKEMATDIEVFTPAEMTTRTHRSQGSPRRAL